MTPEPHTMTDEELLRFFPDSPLHASLLRAREQLEQAGKALTAARTLQEAAGALRTAATDAPEDMRFDDAARFMQALPGLLKTLYDALDAFGDTDDGELGQ